jgi:hypothetical protein
MFCSTRQLFDSNAQQGGIRKRRAMTVSGRDCRQVAIESRQEAHPGKHFLALVLHFVAAAPHKDATPRVDALDFVDLEPNMGPAVDEREFVPRRTMGVELPVGEGVADRDDVDPFRLPDTDPPDSIATQDRFALPSV